MLRAAAIERKYGNLYFSACCNRNCLPVKDKDGNFDLEKTTKILKYCEAQMIDISGSKKERLNWFIQKLNSCFTSVGANGRLGFNYHIGGINPYDDLRVSDVCQKTFTRAYGITIDKLEHFQKVFKDRKLLKGRFDHDGQQIEPPPNIDAMNGLGAGNGRIKPLNNIHEAKSLVFEDYDLDSTFVETAMVVPDTEEAMQCWTWMKEYFSLTGEPMPNSAGEVHLGDQYTCYSVYQDYVRDLEEQNALGNDKLRILCRTQFNKLWDALYPFVKVRKFKLVSGKCNMCAMLSEIRCNASASGKKDVKQKVNELILLHRSFYMKERQLYYERRRLARENPKEYMSIISDGMAQVHCELPWQANLATFPEKLTQHFQGVLEHGQKISIFRTFENVGTGSNLAIHSLLRVLENRYIQDGGKLPNTIFIQIDGGGENTAKIALALCELLIAKGLTKKIIVTRLPVGHTHEDIDAVFAHIWKKVQGKHCLSPQAYRRIVEEALMAAGRAEKDSQVYDLFAIPDYVKFFTPMLDKKFARYCKTNYTQHQFSFERAEEGVCSKYPLGVKVQYRRYAQDEAIELRKMEPTDTAYDSNVPISAHVVESVWHYRDGSGISLFKEGAAPGCEIKVAPFNSGSASRYVKVLEEVKKRLTTSCHQDWDDFTPLVPASDDSNEYVNNILGGYLHIPFKSVLFNGVELSTTGTVEAHVVNRRGVRAEQLPREQAPACIVTRDRNQDIIREEQAAKRAVRAAAKSEVAKRGGSTLLPSSGTRTGRGRADAGVGRVREEGQNDSGENKRSAEEKTGDIPVRVVASRHGEVQARQQVTQSAQPKSTREIRSRAPKATNEAVTGLIRSTEPPNVPVISNETEPIAEPKTVPISKYNSRSKLQLGVSDEKNDSSDESDSSDWEGKPTVSWNEDTVMVLNRWSGSGSLNEDEYQIDDEAGVHSAAESTTATSDIPISGDIQRRKRKRSPVKFNVKMHVKAANDVKAPMVVEAVQTVTVGGGMTQNTNYSRSTNLNRAAKVDAVNKLITPSRSIAGNQMGRSYYSKNAKALVGKQLKVWYPDETGTSGAHWSGYVKSYCGRKRWHVVFEDGSYTRELSLNQILESVVGDDDQDENAKEGEDKNSNDDDGDDEEDYVQDALVAGEEGDEGDED